tara:strand:- start:90 stop:233 length:144 start_codon:yes stop_codon:yes gene_type:complete
MLIGNLIKAFDLVALGTRIIAAFKQAKVSIVMGLKPCIWWGKVIDCC